jgi:hypothetical protein
MVKGKVERENEQMLVAKVINTFVALSRMENKF